MGNDHSHDLSVVHTADKDGFVCFRHAVKLAMEGRHIDVSVSEDLNSEYNMGRTWCRLCETDPPKDERVAAEPKPVDIPNAAVPSKSKRVGRGLHRSGGD